MLRYLISFNDGAMGHITEKICRPWAGPRTRWSRKP